MAAPLQTVQPLVMPADESINPLNNRVAETCCLGHAITKGADGADFSTVQSEPAEDLLPMGGDVQRDPGDSSLKAGFSDRLAVGTS
jgi:hypothetical protein